jgi:Ca2+:H+ antiporter
MLIGGLKYKSQRFNAMAAGMNSTLLLLSTAGLVVPAVFYYLLTAHDVPAAQIRKLDLDVSLYVAIVLFVSYVLSLVFSLQTHTHLFDTTDYERAGGTDPEAVWSVKKATIALTVTTVFVAVMSKFLVDSIGETTESWGMTEVFVGVIIVAIVGNAAEHSTAILMAMKNKMDIAVTIAIGSSTQVALLLAPVLVFLSYFIAPQPMDLVFSPLEVLAVVLSAVLVNFVALDGKSHWMEGVQLLALYTVLGIAFYLLPPWQ